MSAAARKQGLRFGIYYTVYDSHAAAAKLRGDDLQTYIVGHLRELTTNYGNIDEIWLDDWLLDRAPGLDWPQIYDACRRLAPKAVIAGVGPDVRLTFLSSELGREWLVGSQKPFRAVNWQLQPDNADPIGALHLAWRLQAARIAAPQNWLDPSQPAITSATINRQLQATLGAGHRAKSSGGITRSAAGTSPSNQALTGARAGWARPASRSRQTRGMCLR